MKQFTKVLLTSAGVAVGFFVGKAAYDLTLKKAIEKWQSKDTA